MARAAYSDDLIEIVEWCLKLDHLARPQSAFELQRALMKEGRPPTPVQTDGNSAAGLSADAEVNNVVNEVADAELDNPDTTLSGRLKATLNRKLF